jgi:hypothetical protein
MPSAPSKLVFLPLGPQLKLQSAPAQWNATFARTLPAYPRAPGYGVRLRPCPAYGCSPTTPPEGSRTARWRRGCEKRVSLALLRVCERSLLLRPRPAVHNRGCRHAGLAIPSSRRRRPFGPQRRNIFHERAIAEHLQIGCAAIGLLQVRTHSRKLQELRRTAVPMWG